MISVYSDLEKLVLLHYVSGCGFPLTLPTWLSIADDTYIFSEIFRNFVKNVKIVTFHAHIWNQHEKCIKMSTNKPMFGPVVLEIVIFFINMLYSV